MSFCILSATSFNSFSSFLSSAISYPCSLKTSFIFSRGMPFISAPLFIVIKRPIEFNITGFFISLNPRPANISIKSGYSFANSKTGLFKSSILLISFSFSPCKLVCPNYSLLKVVFQYHMLHFKKINKKGPTLKKCTVQISKFIPHQCHTYCKEQPILLDIRYLSH